MKLNSKHCKLKNNKFNFNYTRMGVKKNRHKKINLAKRELAAKFHTRTVVLLIFNYPKVIIL